MRFKGKVKGDLLLVVVLVLIGVGALFYNQVIVPKKGQATKVIIEIDGQIVQELDLSQDVDGLRLETKHGFNTVEIKDGKVRVVEADCPDLLCVHTGWREHVGQLIVCLPHYFVVKIVGDDVNPPVLDGFTY
ncbi:MAG: NusG domain II-containing protein [Firmicutes bacterium]|nr:NusG domain II-containing protein [Bacillota bacterium]